MYDPEADESPVDEFIEQQAEVLEEAGWSQEEIGEALGDRFEGYEE